MMQNANKHLSSKPACNNILKSLQEALHDSFNISDFKDSWKKMINTHGLQKNKWLADMYGKRDRWVPVWLKDTFLAEMSSIQRSEGMNHFFNGYVNINTSMKQFME